MFRSLRNYFRCSIRLPSTVHLALTASPTIGAVSAPMPGFPTATIGPSLCVRHYRRQNKFKADAISAASIDYLLAKVPSATTDLSTDAIMHALKSLSTAKSLRRSLPAEFLNHHAFVDFCRRIEHSANQFSADEAIDLLVQVHALGVPMDSQICQRLLRVIVVNIADMQIDRALHLANLLPNSPQTVLTGALQSVLPLVLLKKLPEKITESDFATEMRTFEFIGTNNAALQPEYRQKLFALVMERLIDQKSSITAHRAGNLVQALSQIQLETIESRECLALFNEVLVNALDAMTHALNTFPDARLQMIFKSYAYLCSVHRQTYHQPFFDALEQYTAVTEPIFEDLIFYLYFFQKAGFESQGLSNLFIEKISANPHLLSNSKSYELSKVFCCLTTVPDLPVDLMPSIYATIQSNPLYQSLDRTINWLTATRELITIGCYDTRLISSVMSSFDERSNRKLNYLTFLEIYQHCALNGDLCNVKLPDIDCEYVKEAIAVNLRDNSFPLKNRFEQIFGTEQIVSAVRTKYGHFIQHIMKFDATVGKLMPIDNVHRNKDDGFVRLEDIPVMENERLVAVDVLEENRFFAKSQKLRGVFKLKHRALVDLKMIPVIMNIELWANENEQNIHDFILTEITRQIPHGNK